ncbi:MAG TPA: flagella basal body P-ring formation protein FlgA [Bryobacteraceae bacterium]|nr:flagella basal body P-ring formation protein FlgA [Bryobacteraceae bacterium]
MTLATALAACIVIEGASITAADIARGAASFTAAPPSEIVAPAPGPGARRTFGRRELRTLARRFSLPEERFDPVCYKRKADPLPRERVLEAVRAAAGNNNTVELVDYSRTQVPPGTLEFTASRGEIWAGRVRYAENRSVPVWARVRGATDIGRGDTVAVEAVSGGARVVITARAETPGSVGDTITLRREDNRRSLRARVSGKGKAIINANGFAALPGDVGDSR